MIRITRVPPYFDMLRSYKIYIDGVYRGKIKIDEMQEFEVDNGSHTVCAKIDWGRSNELLVNVNDSIVELEVGSAMAGRNLWKFLFWKLYVAFWAHKWLFLREKEAVDTLPEDLID